MAKGIFTPINPQKYLGDVNKIRFLSSWERYFMDFCDTNPNVIGWSSEELKIPYFNPIKNCVSHYWVDFVVKFKQTNGTIVTEAIEIKPMKQSVVGKNMSTYDQVQLVINNAKWTAAKALCDAHGIKFRVVTEQDLFRQPPKKVKPLKVPKSTKRKKTT